MFCLRNTELTCTEKAFDYKTDKPWYPPEGKVSSFRNLMFSYFFQGCNTDRNYIKQEFMTKTQRETFWLSELPGFLRDLLDQDFADIVERIKGRAQHFKSQKKVWWSHVINERK